MWFERLLVLILIKFNLGCMLYVGLYTHVCKCVCVCVCVCDPLCKNQAKV